MSLRRNRVGGGVVVLYRWYQTPEKDLGNSGTLEIPLRSSPYLCSLEEES